MISEDLKVHFTNKLNGDLIIANDINELKDKHNKGIDELVQIEQDVNIVRGGVQGLRVINNGSATPTMFYTNGDYTIGFTVYNGVTTSYDAILANSVSRNIDIEKTRINIRYEGGLVSVDKKFSNTIHLCRKLIGNGSDAEYTVYHNGVLIKTDTVSVISNEIGWAISGRSSSAIMGGSNDLFNLRTFNTALTQQQIDYLYNQGRCDEVRLGDEWRGDASNVCTHIGFISNYETTDYLKLSDTSFKLTAQQAGIVVGCASYSNGVKAYGNKLYKLSFYASEITNISEIVSTYIGKTQVAIYKPVVVGYNEFIVNSGVIDATSLYNILKFRSTAQGQLSTITISNYKVEQLCLLNEYLPSYLTQTKWIDNGVSKQDIALTAPTFTYVKPYKQLEVADVAPTANPVAAGCFYVNKAAKKVYISTK